MRHGNGRRDRLALSAALAAVQETSIPNSADEANLEPHGRNPGKQRDMRQRGFRNDAHRLMQARSS